MRTNRALALALLGGMLGGMLAACGQPGAAPGDASSPPASGWVTLGPQPDGVRAGDILLETTVTTAGEGSLEIAYAITSYGAESSLVHDRVPPTLGSAVLPEDLDPERAWVYMQDKRVRVSKQGFAPAPNVRFMAQPVMGVRLLEPGGQLSGQARVELPFRLDVPGPEFDAPRTAVAKDATELEFCVQVTDGSEGRASAADPTGLEVAATAPGPDELICSRPLAIPSE